MFFIFFYIFFFFFNDTATTEIYTLSLHDALPISVVPKHSHMNEQLTYILEGALRFLVGDDGAEEIVVRAGEVLHLPGNVPHEAHALEDTLDVDVFYPPREDWLKKTDNYLRK